MLNALLELDGALLLLLQQGRTDLLDQLAILYTSMGDAGLLWIALSVGLLCSKSTRKAGVLALAAMALGALCTNLVIKPMVARPRPWLDVAGLIPLIQEPDPYSFPSGHTCAAFAAGMIWMRTLPKPGTRVWAVVLAVCMGLSRLYVGVHYPTDVVAGALIGSFCAWLVWKYHLHVWNTARKCLNREER